MTYEDFVDTIMDAVDDTNVDLATVATWLIVQAMSLVISDQEVSSVRVKAGMLVDGEFKLEFMMGEKERLLH